MTVSCISVVPEATHEASRGPKKGAVSAQKALRGSETETRELLGGREENSASPMRIFYRNETEKIEFVARPGSGEELAGEGAGARPSAAVVRLQKEPADALQKKRGSN